MGDIFEDEKPWDVVLDEFFKSKKLVPPEEVIVQKKIEVFNALNADWNKDKKHGHIVGEFYGLLEKSNFVLTPNAQDRAKLAKKAPTAFPLILEVAALINSLKDNPERSEAIKNCRAYVNAFIQGEPPKHRGAKALMEAAGAEYTKEDKHTLGEIRDLHLRQDPDRTQSQDL